MLKKLKDNSIIYKRVKDEGFRWVKLTNYCIHPYKPGNISNITAEYEMQTPYGETFVVSNNDIVKTDNGYILLTPYRNLHSNNRPYIPVFIINACIDKFGKVKPRKNSEAYDADEKLFKKVEVYNLKMRLSKMGQLDIYNGKVVYNHAGKDIENAIIPSFVDLIESNVFSRLNTHNLKTIKIQNGIKSLPYKFVVNCPTLESIELADTITSIKPHCINGTSIKSIVIPSKVAKIGEFGLANNPSLEQVEFSGTVKYIGKLAFSNCRSLKKLKLPSGISEIPEGIIYGCASLSRLYIPRSVKTVNCNFIGTFNGANTLRIKAPKHLEEQINAALDHTYTSGNPYMRSRPSVRSKIIVEYY